MKTTFKDIKQIREDMSLAPKGKGREAAKKLYKERVRASDATRAKLAKPLTRHTKFQIELKVKNMISDLDNIAWQLENQIQLKGDEGPHWPKTEFLTHAIDITINQVTKLQKIFKSDLRL